VDQGRRATGAAAAGRAGGGGGAFWGGVCLSALYAWWGAAWFDRTPFLPPNHDPMRSPLHTLTLPSRVIDSCNCQRDAYQPRLSFLSIHPSTSIHRSPTPSPPAIRRHTYPPPPIDQPVLLPPLLPLFLTHPPPPQPPNSYQAPCTWSGRRAGTRGTIRGRCDTWRTG
jgi:hypothetical protein